MNKKALLPLIGLFLLVTGIVLPGSAHAQISEGGTPTSFKYQNTLKSDLPTVQIPINFSVEDLKTVDRWQVSQGAPLKVGVLLPTDLTIDNAGSWNTLPDGKRVWRLQVQAKDAIALMLSFRDFYIPENGKLFIYSSDKTHLIGAFTHHTNPPTKEYATEFLAGDKIILEYEAGISENEHPRIAIDAVGYGYNHLHVSRTMADTGPGTSGSCMVNINCEEGEAWQTEKNGVCQMTLPIGNYIYICSGALVNNTAEDLKPYILSAFHCIDLDIPVTEKNLNKYTFYFHFEHTGCENNSSIASYRTITGCKKIAGIPLDGGSDGLLLLLNQTIPEHYNAYYNGWDRSNTAAQSGVGIHHPSGDYMKISTFNKVARTSTWYGIDNIKGAPNAHWNVVFEQTANGHAVTEGGSSGSPLFNQNKQIVGTLSGGSSSCEKPNGANTYGKLYYHWDQYPNKDNTSRMDIYLDPNHTGKTQLAGRYATAPKAMPTDLTSVYQNGEVLLKWKAPVSASEKPEQYNVYRNNILIGRTFSTSYIDKEPETGIQSYSVSASYTDNKESAVATTSIYVYELKIPTDVTTSTDGKNILVKWKEPIYQQMIYWGNGTTYLSLGFKQPFYFGQRWNKEDLKPLHGHLVESVSFIPTSGSSYTLNIIQGKRKYVQKLTNLPFDKLIEIPLKEPFVIDASQELIIAFHAEAKLSTAYPAVMDEGPAVNGKGNLISFDGETWEYLYEPSENENENENYDFNFFLAATVSSKTKDIPTIKTASNDTTLLSKSSAMPILTRISEVGSSLRSSQASAFPTITGYNIYRNGSKIGNVPNKFITQYIDKQAPTGSILYQVSTLYGKDESKKADADKEVNVGNEKIILSETTISPTVFTDQVELFGNEKVDLLEVITLDGKTIIRQKNPGKIVYTGSLSSGIYIFRIHTDGKAKTMKAQKIN
ncbi:T9SS type A sorting domain-containing protein [Parabacteroides merdae]|uniref:T9SS type A sorting domain-containing protein n=4 Tax=Parabacteroides merdae TaxID=46503 RepID=UPI0039B6730B